MEKREYSEIAAQSKAFTNLWNDPNFKHLRGRVFAINNNSENAIKGALNKAMGVIPGVSDMCLICNSGQVVWIEWKTSTGTQSSDQKSWEQSVTSLGHKYIIVRNETEFRQVINLFTK